MFFFLGKLKEHFFFCYLEKMSIYREDDSAEEFDLEVLLHDVAQLRETTSSKELSMELALVLAIAKLREHKPDLFE